MKKNAMFLFLLFWQNKRKIFFPLILCLLFITARAQTPIPRPEYPRPQFERAEWINLNGTWTFEFDFGKSGMDRELYNSTGFTRNITVPFCPESKLSGVEHKDFIPAMWYHRTLHIPTSWKNKKIMLNFGAIDYYAQIFINGKSAGRHWGGSSSFTVDITRLVAEGNQHQLVVYVEDNQRSGTQARGKQCDFFYSRGCDYTRTTGIWQTVWMEAIDPCGLKSTYVVPDLDQSRFIITPQFHTVNPGQKLRITLHDGNKDIARTTVSATLQGPVIIPVKNPKTWSPGSPFLYDITYEVINDKGETIDKVDSYTGMRKIHIEGDQIYLNNEPCYQRLVLDQGFYPEGIWTAPTDEALRRDIELSMAAGFNGARMHQKVFEERYHYWADKMGYLTWGESASWGMDGLNIEAARNFLSEWEEVIIRDRNHPSIIIWTPFNEAGNPSLTLEQEKQHSRMINDVYNLTKTLDYRPVNDVSGHFHVVTDIWTIHDYDQNPATLHERLLKKDGEVFRRNTEKEPPYSGQPYFVAEYGGVKWVVGTQYAENTWGYGDSPKTEEEVYQRLQALTDALRSLPHNTGFCYTQLTDVEQEQNGIYNYDRTPKFDMKRIHAIFSKEPDLIIKK